MHALDPQTASVDLTAGQVQPESRVQVGTLLAAAVDGDVL